MKIKLFSNDHNCHLFVRAMRFVRACLASMESVQNGLNNAGVGVYLPRFTEADLCLEYFGMGSFLPSTNIYPHPS